ncbi:MAG TPA: response regulator [Bacteroidales bacterium]|nr:response regulator [Bacteroidales bacterium]HPT21470.1 response regulator [Bacteroidales bacterium]
MKLPKILYAEDNLNDIELALAAFKENNIAERVDIVHDGHEALDYLFYRGKYSNREKSIPDFMLLDIKMPGIDGIEVLKIIRKSEEHKNLPVVMLSSSSMEDDIENSYSYGANGYVIKPIDFNDFINAIKGIGYFWGEINMTPCKI